MKKVIFSILIGMFTLVLISCDQNNTAADKNLNPSDVVNNTKSASAEGENDLLPKIEFEEYEHDFGSVIQGEVVTFGFKFENTGKKDLLIYKVRSSCGCTVTDFPKEAISPGEGGVIKVTFNSKGRKGFQRKTSTVIANTEPNSTRIKIKSIVTIPEY